MNNSGIPTSALLAAARRHAPKGTRGLGDFVEPFLEGTRPATSMPNPLGPADSPITTQATQSTTDLLQRILDELVRMNSPGRPVIRASAVTSSGQTLDWTPVGTMDRLMIRNEGPSSVWMAFDTNGPAVNAFTGDQSFELQAAESINITHCTFQKIGLICAAAGTGTVHAVAFQTVASTQNTGVN